MVKGFIKFEKKKILKTVKEKKAGFGFGLLCFREERRKWRS
jgi:hypothetical protein